MPLIFSISFTLPSFQAKHLLIFGVEALRLPASLSWHAHLYSLGFISEQLLSSSIRTRAQTLFFLSKSNSTPWPSVSSCSDCQFRILPAIWLPLDWSSSSQGLKLLVRADTHRLLSSLSRSMYWLICSKTRSMYCKQADDTAQTRYRHG